MAGFESTSPLRQRMGLPSRAAAVHEHQRRPIDSQRLGQATLACPHCDAPVAVGPEPRLLTDLLACPYCHNRGPVRDFLSLAVPTRPARVELRLRFVA